MNIGYDSMGKWIAIIHRQFQSFVNERLKEYGIGSGEFLTLIKMYSIGDGICQDDLAKALFLDKAAVARTIKSLEQKGFIFRKQDPEYYKRKLAFLTPQALDHKDTLNAILKEWDSFLETTIDKDEYLSLNNGLKKISEGIIKK